MNEVKACHNLCNKNNLVNDLGEKAFSSNRINGNENGLEDFNCG